MVLVLFIKDGFYKIEKSIFRPNYARYEKMLRSKIIHHKETYKFCFDHFLEKRMVFILIRKTLLKIKSCTAPVQIQDGLDLNSTAPIWTYLLDFIWFLFRKQMEDLIAVLWDDPRSRGDPANMYDCCVDAVFQPLKANNGYRANFRGWARDMRISHICTGEHFARMGWDLPSGCECEAKLNDLKHLVLVEAQTYRLSILHVYQIELVTNKGS